MPGLRSLRVRLVALSALMLFLELAMIRWLGEKVLYLSFFTNVVLLGSFLGIGLGFLAGRRDQEWFRALPMALMGLVGFVLVFPIQVSRDQSDVIFFGGVQTSGLPVWVMLPVTFAASAAVMAMVGQAVAKTFARFEHLEAYRLDIVGSILGIAGFSLFAFAGLPPVGWGLITVAAVILLGREWISPKHLIALAGVVLFLGIDSAAPGTTWSPYYRVTLTEDPPSGAFLDVNGIPHQWVTDLETRRRNEPFYFEPYRLHPRPHDVLVVGAGTGSDVAIALAEGARRVDAVEIDPEIARIGSEIHPDRPYADDRVTLVVDDGRAFMERAGDRYDLIVFALPDSLTLVSRQAGLRLESYLFTTEAMERARNLLTDDGLFVMYNYYREDWLVDRLARTLEEVFGSEACVLSVGDDAKLAVLAAGALEDGCPYPERDTGLAPDPVTDDYPFLYVQQRSLPAIYVWALLFMAVVAVGSVRVVGGPIRTLKPYTDLFFMGSAFLLLETKNVVQFSLLFGTTWFVNALVFMGILLTVYAAIEVARKIGEGPTRWWYLALFGSLAIAWLVPQQVLLQLPPIPRFISAVLLAFTPVFVANVIFAQRFRTTAASTAAFGANLLGAMFGGFFEYGALVVGYRALLIGAALLYLVALVSERRLVGVRGSEIVRV